MLDSEKIRAETPWILAGAAIVIGLAAVIGLAVVYSGGVNAAADVPHSKPVYWLLDTARDRSVAARARSVQVPDGLADRERIAAGAGLYAEMCSDCHLAPGMEKTEIAEGLYPAAPALSRGTDLAPAEEFWIVKHGLKMSGMAAWGKTHSDALIWDMVAFLQKLPSLSPQEYKTLVQSAPEDHDEMMEEESGEHHHDHDE